MLADMKKILDKLSLFKSI